jgi:hypothetical protein
MLRQTTSYASIYNGVFSRNVNLRLGNSDTSDKILVGMYARLAGIIEMINTLMKEYSKGNFYTVSNILTQELYNKMSLKLSDLAVPSNKYPEFEIVRGSCTSSLSGLYQSVIQYSEFVDIQTQLEICKEHESILHDRVKLQEWINKLNQNKRIFPDSKVQATKATIKPEYAEYIKHFGFPEGAVFEPDKLAFVLRLLGMN